MRTLTRAEARVVVDLLNEAFALDPQAMQALFAHRVPCNSALRDHPTIQVAAAGEALPGAATAPACTVGVIGLLNGLFGVDERGWGHICGRWDDQSPTLLGFELTRPDDP